VRSPARNAATVLTFLGTRGEIDVRSRRHRRHSALLVEHGNARIMIDCGADWLGRLKTIAPTAIVLTHAHPDHAGGLRRGAPCPVYATAQTHRLLARFPLRDRRIVTPYQPFSIGGVGLEAYKVRHSIRAPAVGYRVSAGTASLFYVPDVAILPNPAKALRGACVYVGDGATMQRSMVRMKDGVPIGHAPIAAQLQWCTKAQVRRAIFTHCGSPVVRGNARALDKKLRSLGREHEVDASFAYDGCRLRFPPSKKRETDLNAGHSRE
jgi:phosphoribosyl 1,2-cyclic phosphodiesterase